MLSSCPINSKLQHLRHRTDSLRRTSSRETSIPKSQRRAGGSFLAFEVWSFRFAEPSGYMSTLQKFLAHFKERTEARRAMSRVPRLTNRGSAFVETGVAAAFVWTLALSASPKIHERVTSDAHRGESTCPL